ncbi:MAG: transposase [Candidatus Cloacimonadales bacterium]
MLKEYKQVKVSSLNSGLIVDLFKLFKFNSILRQVGIVKQKGHSIIELLLLFMFMILENKKSLYCGLKFNNIAKFKTPINDMLNNSKYNWRNLLYKVSLRFIKLSDTSNEKENCLIFDDTSKEKTGKKTENISCFHDHSLAKYFKGFQNVTDVWSNGVSAIVIDFEMKIGNKKVKKSKRPKYHKGTHTEQRNRFAKDKKPQIVIKMVNRSIQRKIPFKYVLWDSWFNNNTSYKFVFDKLVPLGKTLISMLKNGNQKYKYNNQYYDLKELYKIAGKWIFDKNSGIKHKSIIVELLDTSSSKKINERTVIDQIKICFFKYPDVKRWKAILSTDTQLSEIEVLKVYMRRWSIECVFKEIKQYFGYNQSKSSKYSAMIADLTIRYVFYNMLCYKKQQKPYPSMEQLLIELYEELEEASLIIFVNAIFTQKVKDFIDYSIAYGYTSLTELRKDIDIVLRKFFESEVIIDKITEADNQYYDRIA